MTNPSPALLNMRKKAWDLRDRRKRFRKQLERLAATKDASLEGPDALEATWQFINDLGDELDDTSAVQEKLQAEIKLRRSEISKVKDDIEQIDAELYALPFNQFDTPDNEYKLFAVFVHRGTTNAGHYWIYIHDFKKDVWRCYEDSNVTEVADTSEIFEKRDPQFQGTPNFVVYVRNDLKTKMTDALHRIRPKPTEPADIEMEDVQTQDSELTMALDEDETQLYHG
jgi:ubiquitin carboxyl-terminal hydrolase 25